MSQSQNINSESGKIEMENVDLNEEWNKGRIVCRFLNYTHDRVQKHRITWNSAYSLHEYQEVDDCIEDIKNYIEGYALDKPTLSSNKITFITQLDGRKMVTIEFPAILFSEVHPIYEIFLLELN